MNYGLPTSLEVCGIEREIRSDYGAVLDICTALSDASLSNGEKAETALTILYPDIENIPPEHYEEALKQCFWFINGGEEERKSSRRAPLMNWEQDFKFIIAPINKAVGADIRSAEYMHWWTFLAYYLEIGDCLFAQIVAIRAKKAKGKKLTKDEREWYNENRDIVDIHTVYTEEENAFFEMWSGAKKGGEKH